MVEGYNAFLAQDGREEVLVSRPFMGDLHLVLVFDSPESLEYATAGSLGEAGLSVEQAWARAPSNLPARMGALESTEETTSGITVVGGGNGLAPSFLADPTICTQAPYENALLLLVDREVFLVSGRDEFRDYARYLMDRGESISKTLLRCRAGRLEAAAEPG